MIVEWEGEDKSNKLYIIKFLSLFLPPTIRSSMMNAIFVIADGIDSNKDSNKDSYIFISIKYRLSFEDWYYIGIYCRHFGNVRLGLN